MATCFILRRKDNPGDRPPRGTYENARPARAVGAGAALGAKPPPLDAGDLPCLAVFPAKIAIPGPEMRPAGGGGLCSQNRIQPSFCELSSLITYSLPSARSPLFSRSITWSKTGLPLLFHCPTGGTALPPGSLGAPRFFLAPTIYFGSLTFDLAGL